MSANLQLLTAIFRGFGVRPFLGPTVIANSLKKLCHFDPPEAERNDRWSVPEMTDG